MYNKLLTLDKVNLTFYTVCRWLNINNKHEACSSATTVYGCYQSVKDSYFLRAATVIVAENNTNIASHNKHRTITIHLRNCSKLINSFVLCNFSNNFVGNSNTCSCFRGNNSLPYAIDLEQSHRNIINNQSKNTVYFLLKLSNKAKFSSYRQWVRMGKPMQPTKDQVSAQLCLQCFIAKF